MGMQNRHPCFLLAVLLLILAACGAESVPAATGDVTRAAPNAGMEPAPVLELGDTDIRARDGMAMAYVPAGQFAMGSSRESPVHTVALDAFWIDRTEVTNAQFVEFLNQHGNQVEAGVRWLEPGAGSRGVVYGHIEQNDGVFRAQTGLEQYPAIEVSWYGAAAYCAWAGGRLPTEAEWEYAARGPQARTYPWGNAFDGLRVNYCDASCAEDWRDTRYDDGLARWGPVGSFPGGASWCGALDMAGNVWEWVSDWWSSDYYARSPASNPRGPDSGTVRVARGGSWYEESDQVRASYRKGLTPSSYRMHWVGFRCAASSR